jgi:Flp pilus assembly protein TadD
MNTKNYKQLSYLVSLWIFGLFCILHFGGCSEQVSSQSDFNSLTNDSEKMFHRHNNLPPTSKTLYATADILAAQGRDTECEFVLRRIIHEYPRYLPAYNSLAELHMRQGRANDAIETINIAISINPDDPLLLNNLGVCWIVCGEYEKALDMFIKSAGIRSENTRYRTNMALALGLIARYEESLSLYRQVLPEEQANHNLEVLKNAKKNLKLASAYSEVP